MLREKLGIFLQTPEKVELYAQTAEMAFAKGGKSALDNHLDWSWWGFFGSFYFFLYRKCYAWAAITFMLCCIPVIGAFISVIVSALYAKTTVINRFADLLASENDDILRFSGGVNKWVIWLIIAFAVLTVLLMFLTLIGMAVSE